MKPRIAVVAGLTMVAAMSQATPCYADAVSFPDPTATGPLIAIAVVFVVLVSGFSFVLLRRIARRRIAGPPAAEVAPVAPVAQADGTFKEWTEDPEARHED
jgi:hypothetical protein